MYRNLSIPRAPKWRFWMARMFGTRVEGRDDATTCVAYHWRGCVYVMSVKEVRGKAYKIGSGVLL